MSTNVEERNHPQVLDRTTTRTGQQIRETASQLGETAARASEELEQNLDNIGIKFNDARTSVFDKTKEYARATNNYVSKNPWLAVGISAGFAFLAGMLIGRRSED